MTTNDRHPRITRRRAYALPHPSHNHRSTGRWPVRSHGIPIPALATAQSRTRFRRTLLADLTALTISLSSCLGETETTTDPECRETVPSFIASIRSTQRDWIETANEEFADGVLYPGPIYDPTSIHSEYRIPAAAADSRMNQSSTVNTTPESTDTETDENATADTATNATAGEPFSAFPDDEYPVYCEMTLAEDGVYGDIQRFICDPEAVAAQYENWPLGTLTEYELELVLAFAMETLVSATIGVPAIRKRSDEDGCTEFYESFHQHLGRIEVEISDHAETAVTATVSSEKVTEFFTAFEASDEDERSDIYDEIRSYLQQQIHLPSCPADATDESDGDSTITIEQVPGDEIAFPDPEEGGPPDIGPPDSDNSTGNESNESDTNDSASLAQSALVSLPDTLSTIADATRKVTSSDSGSH